MIIDKENNGICFNNDNHVYWNKKDNSRYISVTTLIEKYTQPFDSDFWSKYKALEKLISPDEWKIEKKSLLKTKKFNDELLSIYNIDKNEFNKVQQGILDEWQQTNLEACARGTKIHSQMENLFYKSGKNVNLKRFGIGGKFECIKDYKPLDLEYGVYPEYLLSYTSSDGILRIAGQSDLVIKSGNDIIVGDFKSNREIKTKGVFNTATKSTYNMKYPLSDLPDVNFYHYTMQLSIYAWMIQQMNKDFIIKDLILIHFDHEGGEHLYHCDYLKDKVEALLRDYKKKVIHKQQYADLQDIVY
jgi:hypothetical protein